MIEIKKLSDLDQVCSLSETIRNAVKEDLRIVYEWSDVENEYSFEDFDANITGFGHIAILSGDESTEELLKIGISDGWSSLVPEVQEDFYFGEEHWRRMVVVITDSCSMILWIKKKSVRKGGEYCGTT